MNASSGPTSGSAASVSSNTTVVSSGDAYSEGKRLKDGENASGNDHSILSNPSSTTRPQEASSSNHANRNSVSTSNIDIAAMNSGKSSTISLVPVANDERCVIFIEMVGIKRKIRTMIEAARNRCNHFGVSDNVEAMYEAIRRVVNCKILDLSVIECNYHLIVVVPTAGDSENPSDSAIGNDSNETNKQAKLSSSLSLSSSSNFRVEMPDIFNQLWDMALERGKVQKIKCSVVNSPSVQDAVIHSSELWGVVKDESILKQEHQHGDKPTKIKILTIEKLDLSQLEKRLTIPIELKLLEGDLSEEINGVPYILYDEPTFPIPHFRNVVLGGTFDHMHNGHRKLLSIAAELCHEKLVIGVTGDEMLKAKKHAALIESIGVRMQSVREYLQFALANSQKKLSGDAIEIVEINDPYGPAITDPSLDVIVVSSETLKGARLINEIRVAKNKLKPLEVVAVLRSNVYTLSSTFVRRMNL